MCKYSSLFFALLAVACAPQVPQYTIEGTVGSDMDGQYVYFTRLDDKGQFERVDSTQVAKGAFTFQGDATKPYLAEITTFQNNPRPTHLIIEPGKIQVTLSNTSMSKGTALNDSLSKFKETMHAYLSEMQEVRMEMNEHRTKNTLTPELQEEYYAKGGQIQEKQATETTQFVENNRSNLAGLYVLSTSMYYFDYPTIKDIVDSFPADLQSTQLYKKVKDKEQAMANRQVGAKFTNVKLDNINGQPDQLSNYIGKGKYVLVDFWASWCAPCRHEMPNVVAAYKEYAPKGLEIVGLSFDQNKADWEKAVKDMDMQWPQLSDLKGWKSAAGVAYGVNSIPATLLFDPNGVIVATGLNGDKLKTELAKYLDK